MKKSDIKYARLTYKTIPNFTDDTSIIRYSFSYFLPKLEITEKEKLTPSGVFIPNMDVYIGYVKKLLFLMNISGYIDISYNNWPGNMSSAILTFKKDKIE